MAVVVLVALAAATTNATFSKYDLFADNLGRPHLLAFSAAPPQVPGWSTALYDEYTYGKPFFGENSTWRRYMYSFAESSQSAAGLEPVAPVIVDVISTPDRRRLAAYGLEACYRFHDYRIRRSGVATVTQGINARAISYYEDEHDRDWTTLYWEWPVHTNSGIRYERIVFMLSGAAKLRLGALPDVAPSSVAEATPGNDHRTTDADLNRLGTFLEGFARVAVHAHQQASSQGG